MFLESGFLCEQVKNTTTIEAVLRIPNCSRIGTVNARERRFSYLES